MYSNSASIIVSITFYYQGPPTSTHDILLDSISRHSTIHNRHNCLFISGFYSHHTFNVPILNRLFKISGPLLYFTSGMSLNCSIFLKMNFPICISNECLKRQLYAYQQCFTPCPFICTISHP